jgi:hypothetical protein
VASLVGSIDDEHEITKAFNGRIAGTERNNPLIGWTERGQSRASPTARDAA